MSLKSVMQMAPAVATSWAAFWSAAAATAAAVSSFLIWRIHRFNMLDAVRPELAIVGWTRTGLIEGPEGPDYVLFSTVRNVGRGLALNVSLSASGEADGKPLYCMSTQDVPVIPQGGQEVVNAQVELWWRNLPPKSQGTMMVQVLLACTDARDRWHEAAYNLLVLKDPGAVAAGPYVAPGVYGSRSTRTISGRRLRFRSWRQRVPERLRVVSSRVMRRFRSP